jgi:hypothetical protein
VLSIATIVHGIAGPVPPSEQLIAPPAAQHPAGRRMNRSKLIRYLRDRRDRRYLRDRA